MERKIESESTGALPPNASQRALEVINAEHVVSFTSLRAICTSEGWHFGFGISLVDIILAHKDLGKIKILQSFPAQSGPDNIFLVSCPRLAPQETRVQV